MRCSLTAIPATTACTRIVSRVTHFMLIPQACTLLAGALFLDGGGKDERANQTDHAGCNERHLRRDLPQQAADGCRGRDGDTPNEVVETDGARTQALR